MTRSEWSRRVEVEPSIYAGDFVALGAQLESLLDAGATVFHYDVGDGHFIPEITIGPIVLKSIADIVHGRGGVFDCHLMVEHPARHFGPIREAGGDSVTFHVDANVSRPRRSRLLPDSVSVQVDGGVHLGNATAVREAGANLLVSGSGVFWGDDLATAYRGLVEAASGSGSEMRGKGRG